MIIKYPGENYLGNKKFSKVKIFKWTQLMKINSQNISYSNFDFEHELAILYSSGTTGKPKCICHRTGGVLIQHKKEHQLHCDIKEGDNVFYFTTCGWMMWNWLISVLASKASIVLFDGSPMYKKEDLLLMIANKEKITFKLLITEYFFKFSCDSKIADNKICPRQKHKKDDDILNQRILIPKSDTTVFGRKSSRRQCAHRMIDGVEKRHPSKIKTKRFDQGKTQIDQPKSFGGVCNSRMELVIPGTGSFGGEQLHPSDSQKRKDGNGQNNDSHSPDPMGCAAPKKDAFGHRFNIV